MGTARRIAATPAVPVALALVALSILVPFILRQNAWIEWVNSLWLVERQADAIRDAGHPSLFLHTPETGVFYPEFAFYGGSLFAAAGALALVLGSAWAAFVLVLVVATLCAYGGVLWIARQAGLGWCPSAMAALVVGTSPYTVANLYGRGAWTEIVAISALPLGIAGGLSLARGAGSAWPGACAVAAAAALVAGSHNITVVWGTLVVAAIALVGLWAAPAAARRAIARRRIAVGAGALLAGLCLVAWSLLPSVAYGREARAYQDGPRFLGGGAAFDTLDLVLRPWPAAPEALGPANPGGRFQLPVWVLAWGIAAIAAAVVGRRGRRTDRRLAAGLGLLLLTLVMLLVATSLWQHLPRLLQSIQFPLRIHGYAALVIALLVIVALRLLAGSPRRPAWLAALAAALVVQTGIAWWSAWDPPTQIGRDEVRSAQVPWTFGPYQQTMYRIVASDPRVPPRVLLEFPASAVRDDVARLPLEPDAPGYVGTNVVSSPLVRLAAPWTSVGLNVEGLAVAARTSARNPPAMTAVSASPPPVRVGSVLSALSVAVALALGLAALARAVVRRRSR